MAVGLPLKTTYANGDVYSASDVNDTNGTINLIGQTNNFYAGKNAIINGDFLINQRNFTSNTAGNSYNFDRWTQFVGGATGTMTTTPQTFTLGSAPVAGYSGKTFVQCVTAAGVSTDTLAVLAQKLESVRTLSGQTVTISFWARATSGTPKIGVEIEQSFGTGGSPSADVATQAGAVTISTSWARYSATVAVPALTGKTIGTSNTDYLGIYLWLSAGSTYATRSSSIGLQNNTFQIWGVQVEAGSTATAFETATGSIQGELALCQRYYYRASEGGAYNNFGLGIVESGTQFDMNFILPVQMRATPTSVDYSTLISQEAPAGTLRAVTSVGLGSATSGRNTATLTMTVASGLTANRVIRVLGNNSTSAYIGVSAEL